MSSFEKNSILSFIEFSLKILLNKGLSRGTCDSNSGMHMKNLVRLADELGTRTMVRP